MSTRIYYHHTDSGGVVYYANYLNFLEEARTEYLEKRGISVKELDDKGILFVVSRQEIDYKLPAFYGDTLFVDTKITRVGRVKIEFEYEIKNQEEKTICLARTVLACVGRDLKPCIIPEEIHQKIEADR